MKTAKQLRKEEDIVKKAIHQAIDGGWKLGQFYSRYDAELDRVYFQDFSQSGENYMVLPVVIFEHEFAKALWGDSWANFTEGQSGDTFSLQAPNWKGHLMNMVISVNPINYLGKNI